MRKKRFRHIVTISAVMILLSCSSLKAQTYRILPLGNSITEGAGPDLPPESQRVSYRKALFELLTAGGYDFDMVGHRNAGSDLCPDGDHSGIPGAGAQNIARLLRDGYDEITASQITLNGEPYLDVYPADIILLHIGTQDITLGKGPGTTGLEYLLDQIDSWEIQSGTHVVVFVARIIQRTDNTTNNAETMQFNNNVAAMISRRDDPGIFMVNLESGAGIDYDSELMEDGIHPIQSAYDKMGNTWFESLDIYLSVIPDPPSELTVSPESFQALNLEWQDHSNNETGFEIERSDTTDGGSFTRIHTTGPGTTVFTDTGLNENTSYYYRIRAINNLGPSLYTSIVGSTTLGAPLEAPGELQATAVNDSSIRIGWTDNSAEETAFRIERSESSGSGFSEIDEVSADETSYEDAGLADGRTYFYRVAAINENQSSEYSNEASATTVLTPPSELFANAVNDRTILLQWTDNSVSESGYIIERSGTPGSGFEEHRVTAENENRFTDSELADGSTFYYRIKAAADSVYSDYSNESGATTALSAPTELAASAIHEDTVILTWLDNSVSETGYLIERSEQAGTGYAEIHLNPANTISYVDSDLEGKEKYFYRIRATNGVLYSEYSNETQSGPDIPESDSLFSFYPNPCEGYLTLVIQNTEAGISEAFVRLADFSGRVHYFEELELSDSGQTEVFEMELPANLKDGFYSLSLITDKRTVAGKLVLMK